MTTKRNKPGLYDYADLAILKLAKWRKKNNGKPLYEQFFDDYHFEQYQKDIRMILKRGEIKKVLSELNDLRIFVDLGCGVGHILKLLPADSIRIGIDFSSRTLQVAKWHLGKNFYFIQASAAKLPLAPSSVDFLACLEVLEHLPDDEAAVKEISNVIRPGGFLILSVPNSYYFSDYEKLMGHFRHYNCSTIETLLLKNGFIILRNLNMFTKTNRRYLFFYIILEAVNTLLNRLRNKNKSIYQISIPFTSKYFYDSIVAPFFLKRSQKEILDNCKPFLDSTFVLAKKAKNI